MVGDWWLLSGAARLVSNVCRHQSSLARLKCWRHLNWADFCVLSRSVVITLISRSLDQVEKKRRSQQWSRCIVFNRKVVLVVPARIKERATGERRKPQLSFYERELQREGTRNTLLSLLLLLLLLVSNNNNLMKRATNWQHEKLASKRHFIIINIIILNKLKASQKRVKHYLLCLLNLRVAKQASDCERRIKLRLRSRPRLRRQLTRGTNLKD